jgi:hypothetical protein
MVMIKEGNFSCFVTKEATVAIKGGKLNSLSIT